jgi:hypothetical protein
MQLAVRNACDVIELEESHEMRRNMKGMITNITAAHESVRRQPPLLIASPSLKHFLYFLCGVTQWPERLYLLNKLKGEIVTLPAGGGFL